MKRQRNPLIWTIIGMNSLKRFGVGGPVACSIRLVAVLLSLASATFGQDIDLLGTAVPRPGEHWEQLEVYKGFDGSQEIRFSFFPTSKAVESENGKATAGARGAIKVMVYPGQVHGGKPLPLVASAAGRPLKEQRDQYAMWRASADKHGENWEEWDDQPASVGRFKGSLIRATLTRMPVEDGRPIGPGNYPTWSTTRRLYFAGISPEGQALLLEGLCESNHSIERDSFRKVGDEWKRFRPDTTEMRQAAQQWDRQIWSEIQAFWKRLQGEMPELTVTHYGEDGVHGPLDFYIRLTHRGKPMPDVPIRFDVTGHYKCLADTFLVWDSPAAKWREVTRNKIFGVEWDIAPRTDRQGQVVLRFHGDFGRIKMLQPLPASIRLEAETPEFTEKSENRGAAKAAAEAVIRHRIFARTVRYREGSVTYPEVEPGHRVKKVTHGQWVHPGNNPRDLWRIYGLITLGHDKPFAPASTTDGYFWMPLEPGTLLQIDPHRRVTNPAASSSTRDALGDAIASLEGDEPSWRMPVAAAVGVEVEWIDGTSGMFFVHREEKDNGLYVMLSPNVSSITHDRVVLFVQQEAQQMTAEYVVKKVLRKVVAGQYEAAVDVGIMVYEMSDIAFDVLQAIAIMTGTPYELPNGGTFIRLRSEVAYRRNEDGKTSTLYCLGGTPAIVGADGTTVQAKAGEAIRFDVGGAADPAVAATIPPLLLDAIAALNDPAPPADVTPSGVGPTAVPNATTLAQADPVATVGDGKAVALFGIVIGAILLLAGIVIFLRWRCHHLRPDA